MALNLNIWKYIYKTDDEKDELEKWIGQNFRCSHF